MTKNWKIDNLLCEQEVIREPLRHEQQQQQQTTEEEEVLAFCCMLKEERTKQ